MVPNEDFPNTEDPSWDGAPKAGVDGDAVFALAPKALTVGGLGFANAEVPNVLLPNADTPEPNLEETNTNVDLRFANAPKPLEGAPTLVFPNGEEAVVVDAAVFPDGLDWTCADHCVGEPSASSASGDIAKRRLTKRRLSETALPKWRLAKHRLSKHGFCPKSTARAKCRGGLVFTSTCVCIPG